MKKITLFFAAICLLACTSSKKSKRVLLEEDFISDNTGWIIQDTLTEEFAFTYQELKMPLKVTWVTAKDEAGCLRVAKLKLEKTQKKNPFDFEDIQTSKMACAMKSDSQDTTRFETVLVFGKFHTFVGDKEYNYDNSLMNIKGNGEITNMTR